MAPSTIFLLVSILTTVVITIPSALALEENGIIEMPFTESPPTVDGKWTTPDEWNDASETLVTSGTDQIYLRVKHDRDFLYAMVDVITEQVVTVPSKYGAQLLFDTNNDGGTVRGTDDLRFPTFAIYENGHDNTPSDPGSVSGNTIDSGDSSGSYRDVTSPANYQKRLGFSSTNDPYEPGRDHLVVEFKIPLLFLHKSDRYGFGLFYWSGDPSSTANSPQKLVVWPSNLDRMVPNTYGTLQAAQNTITAPPVPFISVSTKSLSFGDKEVSGKATQSVTVKNTGTGVLKINSVRGTGEFSASGITTPTNVQPGQSVSFDAVFAPLSLGEKSGSIIISSNDLSSPSYTVSAEGKGVEKGQFGGCLIATATYGTELAPQVQFLREIRDNTVLGTASGTSFMTAFNTFYYSFSPAVSDWERQNPIFKEVVKITITPLLSSLSLLQYIDIDSEAEMLSYGIGIILLNIGMYFAAPAIVILEIRRISS